MQQQSSPSEPPREEINLLKEKIEGQLEAGKDAKIGESLDINTLAPRKVDWDLRKGIKEKLDKLDKRTNKAIIQLISWFFCLGFVLEYMDIISKYTPLGDSIDVT